MKNKLDNLVINAKGNKNKVCDKEWGATFKGWPKLLWDGDTEVRSEWLIAVERQMRVF